MCGSQHCLQSVQQGGGGRRGGLAKGQAEAPIREGSVSVRHEQQCLWSVEEAAQQHLQKEGARMSGTAAGDKGAQAQAQQAHRVFTYNRLQ